MEAEAQPKQVIASVAQLGPCLSTNFKTLLCDQVSARQERIINMIDALLGEEEEGKEEMLHCSLDSIDRIGDSHLLPHAVWERKLESGPLLKVAAIYLSLDKREQRLAFSPAFLQICVNNNCHPFHNCFLLEKEGKTFSNLICSLFKKLFMTKQCAGNLSFSSDFHSAQHRCHISQSRLKITAIVSYKSLYS